MRSAVLIGVGAHVPPRAVTNEQLTDRLETSDAWIRSRTGIAERHVVDPGTSTSDLAVEAATEALKQAGAFDVDLVILATTTPDRPCPATAPAVAARLGLSGAAAFDIAAVCSGFIYALRMATTAITSGDAERVLVIGAESFTTLLDPTDRTTAPIFGDGAGAVVLRAGDIEEPGALLGFDWGSDGNLADLITVRGGGSEQRSTGPAAPGEEFFEMDGKRVFLHAVTRMSESSKAAMDGCGWQPADVDRFIGHQANKRILLAVAERLGVETDRLFTNLEWVGNTAAASIPLALADAQEQGALQLGQRVLLTAFGGGATWASAALTWPDLSAA